MSSSAAPRTTNRFHADPELSYTLPGRYYFDAGIYASEKEEIFFKSWQFAGYVHELREPGDYVTARIVDQPVFVVRAKDGALRAYYNACMHRGHILLEGSGNVRMITCPFHAWTYDLEGNLKAAGNSENVAGFDHGDFCLPEIGVEEFANMVFVNLDAGAPSLASQAGDLAEDFRTNVVNFDRLRFGRRDPYKLKCNWKFVMDQNECYHCPIIHPRVSSVQDGPDNWTTTEYALWSKHLIRANPTIRAEREQALREPIPADDLQLDMYIWFLWPNLVFVTQWGPANFRVMHCMPEGPELTIENVDTFVLNDPPSGDDIDAMNRFRDVVQPQDTLAMEQQQLGVHARGYWQGRLMVDKGRTWRSEHAVHHFDDMVWRALNGPDYGPDTATAAR